MPEYDSLEEIAKEAALRIEGNSVLDVGTGFGAVVDQVLTTTGCSLVSIDPEAWTFSELEDKYETEIATGRLKLLRENIDDPPFEDNEFDSTISISSMHHLASPEQGLRNMERVTSRRLIVADWNRNSAGMSNPHSPEDLERSESVVKQYFRENSYHTIENEYWFIGWKDF
ncbi:hypothetical protein IX51_05005 [uncultured archaeon]|nr:hypothetical protein IX51_05005 [uncultured archaeon]